MRYVLGYLALMLGLSGLGMLISGQAVGFVLILIAAAIVYLIVRLQRERRRASRFGDYGAAIEGYEKHFAAAEEALEAKLPQDALDNPALVELLSGEDAERAEAIREDYARLRQRFIEWQEDFERMREQSEAGAIGLPARFAEHYAALDQQLSELLEEVERLEARAAEARRFGDNPLEEMAQAALKLEQATSVCRAAFGNTVPVELQEALATGAEKLEQARGGLEKGAERPLVAARLAREACELAAGVSRRADELVKLPREVGVRRAELERTCARLKDEISDVKAKLELAADQYAPACLLAIRGVGAAAEQAVEHARALVSADADPADTLRLDEAKESLARAAELVGRIERHLAELEQAALETPGAVEEAELEIDRTWASATASAGVEAGTERIVGRARELAAEARTELGQPRPDWFRAMALAKRALNVVHELAPPGRPTEVKPVASGDAVELARAAADAALAEARPLVSASEGLTGPENMASLFLERGEFAYSKAVALQKQIAGAEDRDALHAAIDGFRLAEDAAAAAHEHALGLRGADGSKSSSRTTATIVWGTLGAAAFRSD